MQNTVPCSFTSCSFGLHSCTCPSSVVPCTYKGSQPEAFQMGGKALPQYSSAVLLLLAAEAVLLLAVLPLASSDMNMIEAHRDEKRILLQMKSEWGDPPALGTWIDRDSTNGSQHCHWTGIQCIDGAVVGIVLRNQNIDGPIPVATCGLVNLSRLDLSDNYIPGSFPAHLYNCSNLNYLNLSVNLFVGNLPSDIHRLSSKLKELNLSSNNFTGDVPPSIGRLPSIRSLHLENNLFDGSFPAELGNLSTLEYLALAYNPFAPASIPREFGNMSSLKFLWMTQTNLVGKIPETIGKATELEQLDLSTNSLMGTIPASIWMLEKLRFLYLYNNSLSGEISRSIRCLALQEIDVSTNQLTGSIPADFGKLENLSKLIMYDNQISGEIPASIGLLPALNVIRLFINNISGALPPELGKHSNLCDLQVSENNISGSLPTYLCAGKSLTSLVVFNNRLTGSLPTSLSSCSTLEHLMLSNNNLSGDFPVGIWSAVNLTRILISHNSFTGTLPEELPRNLNRLVMDGNKFSGSIPSSATNLQVFIARNNLLSGTIPMNLTGVSSLQNLCLGGNHISGPIPPSISTLLFLVNLDLSNNTLTGNIPPEIASLPDLISLDLSNNYLSGSIPPEMANLKLNAFNLSHNQLSGQIPIQFQIEVYMNSFLSNAGLCTSKPMTNLSICPVNSEGGRKLTKVIIILLPVLGTLVVALVGVIVFLVVRECRRKRAADRSSWKLTYFHKLDFDVDDIVSGLVENNLIGSGGSGKVYSITLGGKTKEIVAVKNICNDMKLDSRLNREFEAEVKYLSSIRHVNIVKLLCCMTSSDAKLLIYEYMQNGSLDQWPHNNLRTKADAEPLNWSKRLSIAVGAARGLCHMHHDCSPPIIHRDIKSGNILLDSEFGAKIADFGLARMLLAAGESASVSTVAGSFGYIAPEVVSSGKISEKVDVYSFGVVLLELTTGRRATNGDEHECLAEWAQQQFRQRHGMPTEIIDEELSDHVDYYLDEIATVFELGLMCTSFVPSSRPSMNEVLQLLMQCHLPPSTKQKLRDDFEMSLIFQEKKGSRRKSLSDAGEEENDDIIVEIV